MRYLLDKVTVRAIIRGLFKLSHHEELNPVEEAAIKLFSRGITGEYDLYISPATANIVSQFAKQQLYARIVKAFLQEVLVIYPTRYFKRWSRRLREQGFTREDAAILALATFASLDDAFLSMHYVATFDQHMINNWQNQQNAIQTRFQAMHADLIKPYTDAKLPQVIHPHLSS